MKGEILLDRESLRELVREVLAEEGAPPREGGGLTGVIDDETCRAIKEHTLLAHKTYLTRKELAKYLAVSERSISEWVARPVGENPLPERRAGGEPRYKREEVDAWAAAEARRQRLKLA